MAEQHNHDLSAHPTARAYDALAPQWQDAVFSRSDGLRQHRLALAFLDTQQDRADAWALHVGCGCNTRFNALLRQRQLQIAGVDISAQMLALARQADPSLQLHHADICAWSLPRSYRFISAWDSIWHVRLAQQEALMRKLLAGLEPGGVLIFSAGGLAAADEHANAVMGPELHYSSLGIPALLQLIAEAGCICRHLEFDQWPQPHVFIVAQRLA